MSSDKNYYSVLTPKCDTILHSSTPSGAAAKVYTHCIRSRSKKVQRRSHNVKIQRRSGDKKVFDYRVKEEKTDAQAMRGDKLISYEFKVKVKSLNKNKNKNKKNKK